jgi:hypothetical protein
VSLPSTEDGKRSSFQKVVISSFFKIQDDEESPKKPVTLNEYFAIVGHPEDIFYNSSESNDNMAGARTCEMMARYQPFLLRVFK